MILNKSLKIVYCIPSLAIVGGGQRILAIKANYFVEKLGYEVHVIVTDNGNVPPYFHLHPSIQIHDLAINYDRVVPLYRRFFSYFYKRHLHKKRLNACLKKLNPDFTIIMLRREISFIMSMQDSSIKIAENHFEKHSYLNNADYSLLRYFPKIAWRKWQKIQMECLKKMHRFVVLTYEDEKQWTELDNITVIPNSLTFIPEKKSSCTSKQVIAVGRYVNPKGFDLLIAAWEKIAPKHKDWVLKIYGDGPLREALQAKVDAVGLSTSCILELPVKDIAAKYAESSIFVLSSRFEGFGLVMVEAMACGLPVVSFDCSCGPKDIISNHEDGILVEAGNVEELARQIAYLIEHDEIREQMGQRALENVQRYKIENIAVLWQDLFKELLQEKKSK